MCGAQTGRFLIGLPLFGGEQEKRHTKSGQIGHDQLHVVSGRRLHQGLRMAADHFFLIGRNDQHLDARAVC